MYNWDYRKVSQMMKRLGIVPDIKGRGKREGLTPGQVELFKMKMQTVPLISSTRMIFRF